MRSLRPALLLLLGLVVALAGTLVPASSGTAAAALGSISGQMLVTGGAPIPGAEVTLYAEDDGDFHEVDLTETDATGSYLFTDVEAGAYRLRFLDPTGDHVTEYWDNAGTMDTAKTLVLGPGENRTGVSVMVTRAGHVTGTVTGDGASLADVRVQAYQFSYAPGGWVWKPLAETRLAVDGTYDLGGLSSGTYRIGFTDGGGTYLPEFWDDAATVGAAQDVVVKEDQVTAGTDAELERGGAITGTVSGAEGPLADADVTAYVFDDDVEEWTRHTTTSTDENGAYRIGALPTDSYRLRFSDAVSGHLTEFWDDAASLGSATSIPVEAGATVPGTDAELALGGRISGVVTGSGGPLRNVYVFASRLGTDGEVVGSDEVALTDAEGAYELRGLPSGDYVLTFFDLFGHHVQEYWDDAATFDEATPIAVVAGQAVTDRDAELARGAEITGTVSGPHSVDWVWVTALAKVGGEWDYVGGAYVEPDGTYAVRGLPAGTYRLAFEDEDGNLRTEFWNDKPTLALADDITVAMGATASGHDAVLASTRTTPTVPAPTPVPSPVPAPVVPAPTAVPNVAAQLADVATGLRIKGKPVVGKSVKVTHVVAQLRTRVRYSFQWYAGSTKIKKATKSSLKVTRAMRGKVLKVKVRLTAGGTSKAVTLKVGKVA